MEKDEKKDKKAKKEEPKITTSDGQKQSYVVEGATLKCSCGDQESKLKVISHHVSILDRAQANIMDFKPNVNIKPFGKCNSMQNPMVSSATAANHGRLQKMPCNPAVTRAWINGKQDKKVAENPALLNKSTNMCIYGGIINITNDGQPFSKMGPAPPPVRYEKDPNALPEDKGNIMVDGVKYPIYVPEYEWGTNANYNKDGWKHHKTRYKKFTDIDILGIILETLGLEGVDDVKGTGMNKQDRKCLYQVSFCTGLIKAIADNTVTTYICVEIQKKGNNYRAIVQYGATNIILRTKAGDEVYAASLLANDVNNCFQLNKDNAHDIIKYCFDCTGNKPYDLYLFFDSKHKNDRYTGYLSIPNSKITLTPKLYKEDKAELGYFSGFLNMEWKKDMDLRDRMKFPSVVPNNEIDKINKIIMPDIKFIR